MQAGGEGLRFDRIYAIAARKFASLRRDKRMFGFIIIMPALQILLFGWAIGGTPTDLEVSVVDDAQNMGSASLIGHLNGSDALLIEIEPNLDSARESVANGESWAVIHIHADGNISVILDNSNQQVSNTVLLELRNALEYMSPEGLPLTIEDPIYGEKDPAFIDFLAPGIMTLVCFMFSLILTTMAFVGERHDGTLDRIFAAGTKPSEVLLGHLAAFTVILVGQVSVVIAISVWGFDIPVEGSILLLFAVCLLLGWAAMCLGLVVSGKAKSEFQAMQINMPMIFPALLLSGILWPVEALPDWLQPVAWALPTTWTAEACRSIMVRGWGLESEVIWMAFLANAIFAGAMLLIAARTLRVRV